MDGGLWSWDQARVGLESGQKELKDSAQPKLDLVSISGFFNPHPRAQPNRLHSLQTGKKRLRMRF